jgi:hypothetical protein
MPNAISVFSLTKVEHVYSSHLFQTDLLTGSDLWWAILLYRPSVAMQRKKGDEIGSNEHHCSELLRKKVKLSP